MGRYRSLLVEGTPIGIANTQPALDGEILTSEDLSDMETTRGYKGVKPYISRGHDGVMDGGGEGAVGWFNPSSIRFDKKSGTLYATPESVSDFLKFEIEEGKYHKLSIEYSWTNYGDVPLYDEKGNRISDKSAIRRWYFQSLDETSKAMLGIGDTNIYDGKGNIIKPRSIFKHYLLERVGSTNAYDMDHNSDEYLWLVAMVKKIEDYEISKQVYAIQKAMGFVRD